MSTQTASPMLKAPGAPDVKGQWLKLTAAFLGWAFDGFELGIGPVALRSAFIDLLHQTPGNVDDGLVGTWISYATASFLLGAALGGIVFGWLGDKIGRVKAMSLSILFYSLFTGTAYLSAAPWHMCAFRFLGALGMGGEWALGVALVMEAWPQKYRPLMAGIIGAAANVGFLLVGLIAVFFPVTPDSWRWVMLLGATPAVLTLLISVFVPESEAWQHAVKTAAAPSKPIKEVLGPGLIGKTLLAIAISSVALIGTWGSVQWIPFWIEKNVKVDTTQAAAVAAQMRLRAQGAAQSAAGKTLTTVSPDEEIKAAERTIRAQAKASAQSFSAFGAIAGTIIAALCGGWLGRRITYFMLCTLSLGLCALLFRGMDTYNATMMVVIALVGGLTASFYGWLPLYLPELFPTRVRATGQGLSYNFGRIIAAAGVFGSGALVSAYNGDYGKMCGTVTLIYVVGMAIIWLGPETKGKPLPE